MASAFCLRHVCGIVDGQEDMRCCAEVRKGFFQGKRIGSLHEHVGHAGAEEHDGGFGEGCEFFAFEVS